MKRRTHIILWLYLAGALICEFVLLWGAYDSGGFQRQHTAVDLAIIAGFYLAAGLLWPAVLAMGVLQYFGFLPHPITF